MVYVIQVCWQLASNLRTDLVPSGSCSQAASKPVWHIPLLCVERKTPDDGQRNCAKHVEFYSKNKFQKLVHLFGFIIRIYHDAQSSERQKCDCWLCGLRRRSAAAWLLAAWFRILLRAWIFVSCVCCALPSVVASATSWLLFQRSPTGCVWFRNLNSEDA